MSNIARRYTTGCARSTTSKMPAQTLLPLTVSRSRINSQSNVTIPAAKRSVRIFPTRVGTNNITTPDEHGIQGEMLKRRTSGGKFLRAQSRVIEWANERCATANSTRRDQALPMHPREPRKRPHRTTQPRERKRKTVARRPLSPLSSRRTRELLAAHNSRILNLSILDGVLSRGWHLAGSQRPLAFAERVPRGATATAVAGGGEGGVPREIKIILSAEPSLCRSYLCASPVSPSYPDGVVLRYPGYSSPSTVHLFLARRARFLPPFPGRASASASASRRPLFILLSLDWHQLLTSAKQRSFGTYLPGAAYFTASREGNFRSDLAEIGEGFGHGN